MSLPPLLRKTWYTLNKLFRGKIAHLDITPDQYTILRWLEAHRNETIIQRDLVELMASDPNTIVAIVSRMESQGLIERKQSETDRRVYELGLTEEGIARFRKARPIAEDLQARIVAGLSDKEIDQLLTTLEKVAQNASAIRSSTQD